MIYSLDENEVGLLGRWNGPLGQTKIGVAMNDDTLQMFSLRRYGFVPDSLLENKMDWTLHNKVIKYQYEEIKDKVFLILEDK